ncbi:MAG: hypothetical protein C0418_05975, partial [Coriobacteriaceae bacterium]|nr:hypothetical protein [Coriobacteriaceae bacterium]
GQLTTGVLKLFGIGVLAAGAGLWVAGTESGFVDPVAFGISWFAATVVVGGSANLVNLADLRPLRALKTYVLLAIIAAALGAASLAAYTDRAAAVGLGTLVLLVGPALAVWGPDAAERGMLGDAGANAAGALAGFWLARGLVSVPVALGVAAAIIVALNLISERVSFSEVIERNRVLKWLDMLGRPKE